MILNKLQEALSEVGDQRKALDEVEHQLRLMISRLSGFPNSAISDNSPVYPTNLPGPLRSRERDRLDDIIDILRSEGRPMHITKIAELLTEQKGTKIDRTQIEPGLNRHVSMAKTKRVDKFGPSMFGLPEWKIKPTSLAHAS